jgi:hypothetical protein
MELLYSPCQSTALGNFVTPEFSDLHLKSSEMSLLTHVCASALKIATTSTGP